MTLDEAIKHTEEVADKKKREKQKWDKWLESGYDHRAVAEKVSCESCAEEHRQLAEWLKELNQLREQTSWIPISEKLPEDNTEVLVTTYDIYDKKVRTTWYQDKEHGFLCGLVKAWMPKPKPYEVESEEQK